MAPDHGWGSPHPAWAMWGSSSPPSQPVAAGSWVGAATQQSHLGISGSSLSGSNAQSANRGSSSSTYGTPTNNSRGRYGHMRPNRPRTVPEVDARQTVPGAPYKYLGIFNTLLRYTSAENIARMVAVIERVLKMEQKNRFAGEGLEFRRWVIIDVGESGTGWHTSREDPREHLSIRCFDINSWGFGTLHIYTDMTYNYQRGGGKHAVYESGLCPVNFYDEVFSITPDSLEGLRWGGR